MAHEIAPLHHSEEALLALPGVGRYIANAIHCFAYSKRVPLVDVNVVRLYHRVFGLISQNARPREDQRSWEFAENMVPYANFKGYNLALIDFSVTVCSGKPQCSQCPIFSDDSHISLFNQSCIALAVNSVLLANGVC